jgi:hypothetical protein
MFGSLIVASLISSEIERRKYQRRVKDGPVLLGKTENDLIGYDIEEPGFTSEFRIGDIDHGDQLIRGVLQLTLPAGSRYLDLDVQSMNNYVLSHSFILKYQPGPEVLATTLRRFYNRSTAPTFKGYSLIFRNVEVMKSQ